MPENLKILVCRYLMHYNFLGQLWKLDGTKLTNKANLWKSTDKWTIQPKDKKDNIDVVALINVSTKKALGVLQNGVVTEQNLTMEPYDSGQLWGKIPSDIDPGYFMLTNVELFWSEKMLTAASDLELELKGMH